MEPSEENGLNDILIGCILKRERYIFNLLLILTIYFIIYKDALLKRSLHIIFSIYKKYHA